MHALERSVMVLMMISVLGAFVPGCDDAATCSAGAVACADPVVAADSSDTQVEVEADTAMAEDTVLADETALAEDATVADDTSTSQDTSPEVVAPAGTQVFSDKSAFGVWFDGPTRLRVGVETSFVVTVHDMSDAPVTDLDLSPRFIHASMGHGGPKAPAGTEVGNGVYNVTSVMASMTGKWNLDVTLPGADRARLVITVTN